MCSVRSYRSGRAKSDLPYCTFVDLKLGSGKDIYLASKIGVDLHVVFGNIMPQHQ